MLILRDGIIRDEGFEYTPYKDGNGNWTIGVGYLIGKELTDLRLSYSVIHLMLTEKIEIHLEDLCQVFGESKFNSFSDARQFALFSMMYTLGRSKFEKFVNMILAIREGNWEVAAYHAKSSKWAKDVDPKQREGVGRDDRIAYMLETGNYHPYYLEKE